MRQQQGDNSRRSQQGGAAKVGSLPRTQWNKSLTTIPFISAFPFVVAHCQATLLSRAILACCLCSHLLPDNTHYSLQLFYILLVVSLQPNITCSFWRGSCCNLAAISAYYTLPCIAYGKTHLSCCLILSARIAL